MIKPSSNTLNTITELIGKFNIIKKLNDEPGYNVLLCESVTTGEMYVVEDRELFFEDHSVVARQFASSAGITVNQVHERWRSLRLDIFNKFNDISNHLPVLKHVTDTVLIYETRLTSQWREMTGDDTIHHTNVLFSLLNAENLISKPHSNALIRSIKDWLDGTSKYVIETELDLANPTLQDMITTLSVSDFYINGDDWMIVNPDKIESRMLPRSSRESSILNF